MATETITAEEPKIKDVLNLDKIVKKTTKTEESVEVNTDKLESVFKKINKLHLKTLNKAKDFVDAVLETGRAVNELNTFLKKNKKQVFALENDDSINTVEKYIDAKKDLIGFGYAQLSKYQKINKHSDLVLGLVDENTPNYLVLEQDGKREEVPATVENIIACVNTKIPSKPATRVNFLDSIDELLSKLDSDKKAEAEELRNTYTSADSKITEMEKQIKELRQLRNDTKRKISKMKKESSAS